LGTLGREAGGNDQGAALWCHAFYRAR